LCLRASASKIVRGGVNAVPDTLVVLPMSAHRMHSIHFAILEIVQLRDLERIYESAFWSKYILDENSLITFASEHKSDDDGVRNRNQLAMDFGTAQSQRRALGLDPAIIWGATCAMGRFEVFSSEWLNNVRFITHIETSRC
jgi:hypothetical protein